MYNHGDTTPIHFTGPQAMVLYTALEVMITEHESTIHICADVCEDKEANDVLLTAVEVLEEAYELRDSLIEKFGIVYIK